MGKVYLHLDCDFESILTFHRSLFHLIAPIAKAKRRRGRKKLSADEKNRFEEAGKRYRFTGKSRRFENLEFDFNATAERSFSWAFEETKLLRKMTVFSCTRSFMSRRKNKPNSLPPFVPLIWEMLNHEAYKKLPASSAKALPYFLGKVKLPYRDPDRYTTEFSFSYPEAKDLGFSPGTFADVIRNLVSYGFIDPVEKGGLRGNGKGYNRFKLTDRWKLYGNPQFIQKDWNTFHGRNKSNSKKRNSQVRFSKWNGFFMSIRFGFWSCRSVFACCSISDFEQYTIYSHYLSGTLRT